MLVMLLVSSSIQYSSAASTLTDEQPVTAIASAQLGLSQKIRLNLDLENLLMMV